MVLAMEDEPKLPAQTYDAKVPENSSLQWHQPWTELQATYECFLDARIDQFDNDVSPFEILPGTSFGPLQGGFKSQKRALFYART